MVSRSDSFCSPNFASVSAGLETEKILREGGFREYFAIFDANQRLVEEGLAEASSTRLVEFKDVDCKEAGSSGKSTAQLVADLVELQARKEAGKISLSESWTDEALRYLRREQYPDQSVKLVAMNYANCTYVGGNYSDGGMVKAQEEELCRQFPALFESMKTIDAGAYEDLEESGMWCYSKHLFGARFGDGYSKARNVLFTEEISCLRSSPHMDYRLLWDPANQIKSGFVEAAAPLFNRGHDDDFQDWRVRPEEWYEKLFLNVFWAPKSVDPSYDVIVVGPFGCGAFGNDPYTVATSFLNVITRHDILKLYKEVHFCLGRSAGRDVTVGGACNRNVIAFREILTDSCRDDYTEDLQTKASQWMEDEMRYIGKDARMLVREDSKRIFSEHGYDFVDAAELADLLQSLDSGIWTADRARTAVEAFMNNIGSSNEEQLSYDDFMDWLMDGEAGDAGLGDADAVLAATPTKQKSEQLLSALEKGANVAVICMLGSLCPITRGHVQCYEEARKILLADPSSQVARPVRLEHFDECLGLISLNPDSHVMAKLEAKGQRALTQLQRASLVRLATADYPWLSYDEDCINVTYFRNRYPDLNFVEFDMNGADDVVKYEKWSYLEYYHDCRMLVMGRPGFTSAVLEAMEICGIDRDDGKLIIGPELPDISSTVARDASKNEDIDMLLSMLHPSVADFLLKLEGHPGLSARCSK